MYVSCACLPVNIPQKINTLFLNLSEVIQTLWKAWGVPTHKAHRIPCHQIYLSVYCIPGTRQLCYCLRPWAFILTWGGGKGKEGGTLRLLSSGFVKLLKYLYLIAIFKTFIELSLTFFRSLLQVQEKRWCLSQLIYWKRMPAQRQLLAFQLEGLNIMTAFYNNVISIMPGDNLAVDSLWLVTIAHSSLFSPPDSVRSHRKEKHPSSSDTLAGGGKEVADNRLAPRSLFLKQNLEQRQLRSSWLRESRSYKKWWALLSLPLSSDTAGVNVYGDKHIILPLLHALCRSGWSHCLQPSHILRLLVLSTFPAFFSSHHLLPSPSPSPAQALPGIVESTRNQTGWMLWCQDWAASVSNMLDHGCLFLSLGKVQRWVVSQAVRHSSKCPTWWVPQRPECGGEHECVIRVCSQGLLPSVSSLTTFSWQAIWPGSDLEY